MGGELVLVLTDVSGHLTWPCQPHPTSHCCNFSLWGKQCCHCSWKSQFRLQARSRVVKNPNYFSDRSLTRIWSQPQKLMSTHLLPQHRVLISWMSSFPHLRWKMVLLSPVEELWSHLQTLTAPGLPGTFLCLPSPLQQQGRASSLQHFQLWGEAQLHPLGAARRAQSQFCTFLWNTSPSTGGTWVFKTDKGTFPI